jgi:hypothetical protein
MRATGIIGALVLAIGLAAQGAHAQAVRKSTLSGTMFSDAVTLAPNGTAAFGAPPPGILIITQLCVTDDAELQVGAKTLALIPGGRCRTWTLGFAVPPATAVACHDVSGNPNACDITGVVESR